MAADACRIFLVHWECTVSVFVFPAVAGNEWLLCVMSFITDRDHSAFLSPFNCPLTLAELSYAPHLLPRSRIVNIMLAPMTLVLECQQSAFHLTSTSLFMMCAVVRHYSRKPLGAISKSTDAREKWNKKCNPRHVRGAQ